MLNSLLKTRQKKQLFRICTHGNSTENKYACNGQHKRLQGMLLTDNGNNIMQTQK